MAIGAIPASTEVEDENDDEDDDDSRGTNTALNTYNPWAMLSWPLRATDWKRPDSFGPYDAKTDTVHRLISGKHTAVGDSPDFLGGSDEHTQIHT